MCSEIVIKPKQCIIKSHLMSVVKVQSVAPVHFRVGRCHQMKKRHHMIVVEGIQRLRESLFLEVQMSTAKAFHDEEGSTPQIQQLDQLWNAA